MKKVFSVIALAIFALTAAQAEAGVRSGKKLTTQWRYNDAVSATANASTRVLATLAIAATDFERAELEDGSGSVTIGGGKFTLTGTVGKSITCNKTENPSALAETFNLGLPTTLGVSPLEINVSYDVNPDGKAEGTYAASIAVACGYNDQDITQ